MECQTMGREVCVWFTRLGLFCVFLLPFPMPPPPPPRIFLQSLLPLLLLAPPPPSPFSILASFYFHLRPFLCTRPCTEKLSPALKVKPKRANSSWQCKDTCILTRHNIFTCLQCRNVLNQLITALKQPDWKMPSKNYCFFLMSLRTGR